MAELAALRSEIATPVEADPRDVALADASEALRSIVDLCCTDMAGGSPTDIKLTACRRTIDLIASTARVALREIRKVSP